MRAAHRKIVFGLVTLFAVSTGMLFFSELALRLFSPQPASWFDVYRRHPSLPFYALLQNVDHVIDTGETRWRLYTDEHGFRVAKPPEAPRQMPPSDPWALVLGDSFTFASGVDYEDSFVHGLDAGSPLRFVNTAVPGYGPSQYRAVLEHMLAHPHKPAIVLAAVFLGNDFHDCVWSKDVPVNNGVIGDAGDLRSAIKAGSHLYRLVSKLYHVYVPQTDDHAGVPENTFHSAAWKPGGDLHEAASIFERELATMQRLLDAEGIPFLVVVIPIRESVEARRGKQLRGDLDYELPIAFAGARLRALGIRFVDMTPVLTAHGAAETYFPYDGHLTPLGHDLVIQAVRPELESLRAAARVEAPAGE